MTFFYLYGFVRFKLFEIADPVIVSPYFFISKFIYKQLSNLVVLNISRYIISFFRSHCFVRDSLIQQPSEVEHFRRNPGSMFISFTHSQEN